MRCVAIGSFDASDAWYSIVCGTRIRKHSSQYHAHYTHACHDNLSISFSLIIRFFLIHRCDVCNKCFQDNIRLRDHMTTIHIPNAERRFQCEVCHQLFAKKHLLNSHLKMKHTEKEDRPYACTEPNCDQRFVMPALLRFHIDKVHNLGDSRVCDICARFFKCSKSYERHYQVEHTNIDQRVQCDLCQKW